MRMVLALTAVACFSTAVGSVASQNQIVGNPENEEIANRILARDRVAIRQAAESNNPQFVPYLKHALDDIVSKRVSQGSQDSATRTALRNALVKLDDTETQQKYWCWLIRDTTDSPVVILPGIGGWFSVQALDAVLGGAGETGFMRALHRTPPTNDLSRLTPRDSALTVVREITGNGPDVGRFGAAAARAWREWIAAHREQLQSVKPTGAGVVFTERACQNTAVEDDW
jgi:hypothetical protein